VNVGGREQGCQPFTLNLLIARTTCPRLFPVINHCALSPTSPLSYFRFTALSILGSSLYLPRCTVRARPLLLSSAQLPVQNLCFQKRTSFISLDPNSAHDPRLLSSSFLAHCASMTRSCAHTHSGTQLFARTVVQLAAIALARAQHAPSRDHHCRQLG